MADTAPSPNRRHDFATTLPWLAEGTALFVRTVSDLGAEGLTAPSLLPGWSRAHVVAHVARNADAIVRLATWARTGVETPMYAGPEARDAEIEASARLPAEQLHADLVAGAAALEDAFDALDEHAWSARVRGRQGRPLRASVLPWMRVREVWLHAVDLAAGVGATDLPPDLVAELLTDVTGTLSTMEGCPALDLVAEGSQGRSWRLGEPAGAPPRVTGSAPDLLTWVTGRGVPDTLDSDTGELPRLPVWL